MQPDRLNLLMPRTRFHLVWADAWAKGELEAVEPGIGVQMIDAWARRKLLCEAIEAIARAALPPLVTVISEASNRAPERVRSRLFRPGPRAARRLGGAHG